MNFFKSELTHFKALELALMGSILLCNIESSTAEMTGNKQIKNIDNLSQGAVEIAQNKVCPAANLLPIRTFDTEKYYVYVCKGDNQNPLGYYVRIPKNLDSKITVPISENNRETYVAINGEVTYQITPYEMLIVKSGRIILREKVVSVVKANGQALAKGCPQGNNTFAQAETRSFFIYICGVENPSSYISITRTSNTIINLPLQKWNQNGVKTNRYVAINGDISFVLTDKILRVSRDGRNIVKEKVLQWGYQ
ncbi:hypothetical protein [Rivularia sp. UHCC 0363]|uniref:hypothetical protein n=1 Tax=Rivularia sp. UHCC 0363 TaxID=3110244 RepID=UPI002B202AEA|nr:hypothetical protein [Rivularia sp. UHCC 0363]MEA5593706.1 hypothetical protein [Rivularia sp. UHCC 0363]